MDAVQVIHVKRQRDLNARTRALFILTCICAVAWFATVAAVAVYAHRASCQGRTTGACNWYWCEFYDGSDRLHDFN